MRLFKKLLIAALPLISAASAAAAQSYRTYGICDGLKARGYYGLLTPWRLSGHIAFAQHNESETRSLVGADREPE